MYIQKIVDTYFDNFSDLSEFDFDAFDAYSEEILHLMKEASGKGISNACKECPWNLCVKFGLKDLSETTKERVIRCSRIMHLKICGTFTVAETFLWDYDDFMDTFNERDDFTLTRNDLQENNYSDKDCYLRIMDLFSLILCSVAFSPV